MTEWSTRGIWPASLRLDTKKLRFVHFLNLDPTVFFYSLRVCGYLINWRSIFILSLHIHFHKLEKEISCVYFEIEHESIFVLGAVKNLKLEAEILIRSTLLLFGAAMEDTSM
jgi:hypothetical protein